MKKRLLGILCMAFPLLAVAGCGSSHSNSSAESSSSAQTEAAAADQNDAVIIGTKSNQFKVVDNLFISDNLPIIVDFNATWCGPCRAFAPIFHSVAEKYKGQALFVSIDTDEYPQIANAYKISAIPTVAFIMPDGQVLGQQQGLMTEQQFVEYVNQLIETAAGESGSI